MKNTRIDPRLTARINALGQLIASHPEQPCRLARFDRQLFSSKGTHLHDYLDEISLNAARLSQMSCSSETRANWLAQRLTDQIDALRREILTQALRGGGKTKPVDTLQSDFTRHQEYARRLQEMITLREQRLAQVETLEEQQQLMRELDALAGRSERCHHALRALEWQQFNRD